MADLKALKGRINSVKQTQKITKAMKMVAASKLRKAREAAENSRPYTNALQEIVAAHKKGNLAPGERSLIYGVDQVKSILLLLDTTDRGLCGGLNTNVVKETLRKAHAFKAQALEVKIWCVGKKGYELVKAKAPEFLYKDQSGYSSDKITYNSAKQVAQEVIELFHQGEFDKCEVIYPEFRSAIVQNVKTLGLIPCELSETLVSTDKSKQEVQFEFEPTQEELLNHIVPKNIKVQLFHVFLETFASEQGARMTAMDNAVNNCAELIKKLNLEYNRTRQAKITTELVEIISAAESI